MKPEICKKPIKLPMGIKVPCGKCRNCKKRYLKSKSKNIITWDTEQK